MNPHAPPSTLRFSLALIHHSACASAQVFLKGSCKKWQELASMLPARTGMQVRERYCNIINPELKQHNVWTEEEDARLLEVASRLKMKWCAVAAELAPRTDNQCWRRYQVGACRWPADMNQL